MILRRTVLVAPLAGALASRPARAQARRPRRIGYLHSTNLAPSNSSLRMLSAEWRCAGFVEGESVFLRAGGDLGERLPQMVEELLAYDPGVLLAVGAPAVFAAARHGRQVPVVALDYETDPVAAGLVASAARPGGRVTGLFLDQPSIAAKWLDLLLEAVPGTRHVAFLWDPGTGPHQRLAAERQAAARGMTFDILEPFATGDHAGMLGKLDRSRTGVVMLTAPGYNQLLRKLSAAVRDAGLPGITFLSNFVGHGLLMGYGPDQAQYWARAVPMAERIIAGEDPGAIPIERPTRFRFAVDLRVADALGLALPPALLAQADEVLD